MMLPTTAHLRSHNHYVKDEETDPEKATKPWFWQEQVTREHVCQVKDKNWVDLFLARASYTAASLNKIWKLGAWVSVREENKMSY